MESLEQQLPIGLRKLLLNARELPFQGTLDFKLLEEWADGIPLFSENDPAAREWAETPTREIDLSKYGYGKVLVKDESVNPTGTIKDRASWEVTTLYRDFARMMILKHGSGELSTAEVSRIKVPRFTVITAGNEGRALAQSFKRFNLPPVKIVVDKHTNPNILARLQPLHADIYEVDLGAKELTPDEIRAISNNKNGTDITSTRLFSPEVVFYDWHVFESFNQKPDQVFMPFGSGRLSACYLYWQKKIVMDYLHGNPRDPRLSREIDPREIMKIDLLCAEPAAYPSQADKLHGEFKPFLIFKDDDMEAISKFGFSGKGTGIYKVSEAEIREAYDILRQEGVACEPSSVAGLALYIQKFKVGKINPSKKALIINTGRGLCVE